MRVRDAIREACRIRALVYHSIGDYSHPSDGFCDLCPNSHDDGSFRDSGETTQYIRTAVLEKLKRDGYAINTAFDPETGIELNIDVKADDELAARRARAAAESRYEANVFIRDTKDDHE